MTANTPAPGGWAYPGRALKRHYIARDGRSLCLRWLYLGPATGDHECGAAAADDQCIKCHTRLQGRRAAVQAQLKDIADGMTQLADDLKSELDKPADASSMFMLGGQADPKGPRPVGVAAGEGNPQEDGAVALSQDVAASTG